MKNILQNFIPLVLTYLILFTVAATDQNSELYRHSNHGKECVHLAAPGEDIISTGFKIGYNREIIESFETMTGTSMAAPYVTAAVALVKIEVSKIKSDNIVPNNFFSEDLASYICKTASCRKGVNVKYGTLNVSNALDYNQSTDYFFEEKGKTKDLGLNGGETSEKKKFSSDVQIETLTDFSSNTTTETDLQD